MMMMLRGGNHRRGDDHTDTAAHRTPSEQLLALCKSSGWNPDIPTMLDLVRDGDASVFDQLVEGKHPIFHQLILQGRVEAVLALMQTVRRLDFSAVFPWTRRVLHCMCGRHLSDSATAALLRGVVRERRRRPAGEVVVDFLQKDECDRHFLYVAAENQKLGVVLQELGEEEFLRDAGERGEGGCLLQPCISLAGGTVWAHDWHSIGQAGQKKFHLGDASVVEVGESTARLWKTVCVDGPVDDVAVRDLVGQDHAADVVFVDPLRQLTLFAILVDRHEIPALVACLDSPLPIDFTAEIHYRNVLLVLCSSDYSEEETRVALQAIVQRLERHPMDKVDWGQLDCRGETMFQVAAEAQKLSLVLPIVRSMPYFADMAEPVHLSEAWSWDIEALEEEEREMIHVEEANVVVASEPTGKLFQLGCGSSWDPDPARVEALVLAGADVNFELHPHNQSPLHKYVLLGKVACLQALFRSPIPIRFTVTDRFGSTPLHCVACKSEAMIRTLLHLILDRLEAHPGDSIRWAQKNAFHRDFLQEVESEGEKKMAVVREVLEERGLWDSICSEKEEEELSV